MEVAFADADLDRMEVDASFNGGFPPEVVKSFRRLMASIRSATDERTFYAMKSLHFEKLKGPRAGQRSMRLNQKWRLVLEIDAAPKRVIILGIEDYH